MVSIGKNIVQGLWNGIASLGGWLRSKIMSWAKAAIPGPIADLLGIRSPSRLMMEYGIYIGEGLAKGLERARNLVRDASEQLASLTITAMPSPALAAQAAGMPTTTTTSHVVHQNAPLLVIQNLTVRNESDIRRIEDIMRQLYTETTKRLRARGMT
nr:MAG: hypothetical protein DIU81_08880 [[Clostridium] cellulosi]